MVKKRKNQVRLDSDSSNSESSGGDFETELLPLAKKKKLKKSDDESPAGASSQKATAAYSDSDSSSGSDDDWAEDGSDEDCTDEDSSYEEVPEENSKSSEPEEGSDDDGAEDCSEDEDCTHEDCTDEDSGDEEVPEENSKSSEPEEVEDPADFLLSNDKYHDCYLTVGIPDTDDVERIGVSSTQLIAHSSVFRAMLADSPLADPSGANTEIKDVSPATFKLMLRHVYGGKFPKLTLEEAVELALCADKYNIQRLVKRVVKHLKMIEGENIFPALMCAAYINCNDLELQVSKIVQQQTDKICENEKFLQLDENCLLFIVKQSMLNITELQLWDNIVRWGENQVETRPDKSLRDCLIKVLPYVRFRSLTLNEIVDHVLPKKVLTPEQFMELTLSVTGKEWVHLHGLCETKAKRGFYVQETVTKDLSNEVKEKGMGTFIFSIPFPKHSISKTQFSKVTIKPTVNVEINTLTMKGIKTKSKVNMSWYHEKNYSNVTLQSKTDVTVNGTAKDEDIVLQVKKSDNKPLVLEANQTYHLKIFTTRSFPVYSMQRKSTSRDTNTSLSCSHFTITFDESHVIKIGYKA